MKIVLYIFDSTGRFWFFNMDFTFFSKQIKWNTIRKLLARFCFLAVLKTNYNYNFFLSYCVKQTLPNLKMSTKKSENLEKQGFANKLLHWISISVLRVFALVAFGDNKISINYNCLLYIPYEPILRFLIDPICSK